MVSKPKFDIKINQRLIMFVISAIIVVSLAILFSQVGTIESTNAKIYFIIFIIVMLVIIYILYKTIKSLSFRFAVEMKK